MVIKNIIKNKPAYKIGSHTNRMIEVKNLPPFTINPFRKVVLKVDHSSGEFKSITTTFVLNPNGKWTAIHKVTYRDGLKSERILGKSYGIKDILADIKTEERDNKYGGNKFTLKILLDPKLKIVTKRNIR